MIDEDFIQLEGHSLQQSCKLCRTVNH